MDALNEEDHFECDEDVEMLDVEEGELVEGSSRNDLGQNNADDANVNNRESQSKNRKRRANKKKNKRKKSGSDPNVMDVNRLTLSSRAIKVQKWFNSISVCLDEFTFGKFSTLPVYDTF